MLAGGEWVDPLSGKWLESVNPFTAEAWALVPEGSAADVDRAVAAAKNAFHAGEWSKLTATARGALLVRLGDLISDDAERLATIESTDNGKLLREMRAQLDYVPQWFRYFGGLADKIEGRVIPIDKPGVFNFTREEPLGVVAAITPWNSPLTSSRLEAGSSPGGREHRGLEAVGVFVGFRAGIRQTVREGRFSSRCREHSQRIRKRRGRTAHQSSRCRQGRVHRG